MPKLTTVVRYNQAHDRYIGRPSYWSNPFKIGRDGTREEVVGKYAEALAQDRERLLSIHELCGQRLACYCAPEPCHGDILAAIANLVG